MGSSWKIRRGDRLSRRDLDRQRKIYRRFDLLCGGLAILVVIAAVASAGQPYELGKENPAGFALWFLLFLAYLPLEILGALNWLFGWHDAAVVQAFVSRHQAWGMGISNLVSLLVIWCGIRFWAGKRYGEKLVRIAGHFLMIFLVWGCFQIFCMVAVLTWSSGGFASLHQHLNRSHEQEQAGDGNPVKNP